MGKAIGLKLYANRELKFAKWDSLNISNATKNDFGEKKIYMQVDDPEKGHSEEDINESATYLRIWPKVNWSGKIKFTYLLQYS